MTIWKGMIAPWTKGVVSASFEVTGTPGGNMELDRAVELYDPVDIYGVMTVDFHNGSYAWDEIPYSDFLAFEESGYSTGYLLANFPISPGRR